MTAVPIKGHIFYYHRAVMPMPSIVSFSHLAELGPIRQQCLLCPIRAGRGRHCPSHGGYLRHHLWAGHDCILLSPSRPVLHCP